MNYYNEHENFAADWLENLIKAGKLPAGEVDRRDIRDVKPGDLDGYTQCHFFAGIGGWPLALQLAGWPADVPVWTGSCPCQPFSAAGRGKGTADERHLWPSFAWLISQCRPSTVFGEQVASPAGRQWFTGVQADMEALGYGTGVADLCAASVGAPHMRQRLYWVAESGSERQSRERLHLRTGKEGEHLSEVAGSSTDDGMAHTHSEDQSGGRVQRSTESTSSVHRTACERSEGLCEDSWLGDSYCGAAGGNTGTIPGTEERSKGTGQDPWCLSDCVSIAGADGKNRRIKSGLEPLVDGLPGRVGQLRAYGNAIVPQVASRFITAYLST